MNCFEDSLKESHAACDLPFWEDCYREAFPGMIAMHDHRQNGDHQKLGIDRSVIFSNGKSVWIDEKVRGRNKITGIVYRDIALEEISDLKNGTPGWLCKPLMCDWIAYAIAPLGRCYLLPVLPLQRAWRCNKADWKQEHPRIEAHNRSRDGYRRWTTISWAIPVGTLFRAIKDCLQVTFDPIEFEDREE